MSHRALLAAAGAQGKTYVEDVFSAYPYTGNGATQTITNGVDLTKGGLVWIKDRTSATGQRLTDTARGVTRSLLTNTTDAETTGASIGVTAFNSGGFGIGASDSWVNSNGDNYASWTFRRAPKFFDCGTYIGNGTTQNISHALGVTPGMIIIKRRDSTGAWWVWHRSATTGNVLELDSMNAQSGDSSGNVFGNNTTPYGGNAGYFQVGNLLSNINGASYVWYAWAHDPDTVNGIVQCGTFTGPSATVNLGWEPQYILVKRLDTAQDWYVFDTSRGWNTDGTNNKYLLPDSSAAESSGGFIFPNATGFSSVFNGTNVYIAIRRGPMRTPTSGASVYNAIARTGTGAAATVTGVGFAPDLVIDIARNNGSQGNVTDRLRGASQFVSTNSSGAESTLSTSLSSFDQDGITAGTSATYNYSGWTYINWFFRRAPQFLEEVCYKGTGANQTVAHNLGVAPKMAWIKDRTTANDWAVYHSALGAGQALILDSSAAAVANAAYLNNTAPTATGFSVGVDAKTNTPGDNYVSYLFGEVAGISKIGSYAGTGVAQTINCGFAAGARLVMIKRTDSTGSWLILDTVRGIISGNDPYLLLDSATAAEVTTADLLTPQSVGFGLTSNPLVNASGGNFIYFAVA